MAKKKKLEPNFIKRAPVVAVMGHIDHGKSTLLDFIRKENTVDSESGGITQHVAAYEADVNGEKITFIDTPGHEAFAAARERGANIADLAILVVAADDGVSPQTVGALEFIKNAKIPFLVAINKIDKSNADINKTKNSLLEHQVYLEGMGGDISYVEISALKGTGIDTLLETVLLMSEVEDLKSDTNSPATGFVLESKIDPKAGVEASLIIKDGCIKSGQYVVSGFASSPIRIMRDFQGNPLKNACASTPVSIIGFDQTPDTGGTFTIFENKKEALKYIEDLKRLQDEKDRQKEIEKKSFRKKTKHVSPLIIKADTVGSVDAIIHEIKNIKNDRNEFKIILSEIGNVTESTIKALGGKSEKATIVSFRVDVERKAKMMAENLDIEVQSFDIIYNLKDYLEERMKNLTPKEKFEEVAGEARILKVFSWTGKGGVIGGEVFSGKILNNSKVEIWRRKEYVGDAHITELQSNKQKSQEVLEGNQFGISISSKLDIVDGDVLKCIQIVEK